jgi:SPP1 family predicted phage head-tail adaptor
MQSGSLDQQIILQSVTETNDSGEVSLSYATVGTVWAHIISQRGNEAFEAARVNARETLRVLIRFRDDVDNKWRFSWNGQNYNIVNVDRSMRREGQLWITGQAVGAL